jgi:hypothetical protein
MERHNDRDKLLLGWRRRGGAGDGLRQWCWKESRLISASAYGGRLHWHREEPEQSAKATARAHGKTHCSLAKSMQAVLLSAAP